MKEPDHNLKVLPGHSEQKKAWQQSRADRINLNFLLIGRWLVNMTVLAFGDTLAITLSMYFAGALRAWFFDVHMIPGWFWFIIPLWWLASIIIRLVPGWGIGQVEELRRSVMLIVVLFTTITMTLFLSKSSVLFSRLTLSTGFLFMLPLIPLFRGIMKSLLIRKSLWGMQAVVYADKDTAPLVIKALREDAGLGYTPIAVYDETLEPGSLISEVPIISADEVPRQYVHAAIVAKPDLRRHEMLNVLEGPLALFRHVVIIPDLQEAPSLWVKPRDVGGILGLEVTSNLLDLWARLIKRVVDIVVIVLTAPFWISVLLFFALIIWLTDRHNPFFLQERVGQGGVGFRILKFRTMFWNAEAVLQQKLADDESLRLEWERNFKLRKDPRITLIGRLLRRTSLDELPQLINVLIGQMSLVGPRPLPHYHDQQLPESVRRMRERVRPGLTGLWQVSGRSESGNEGIVKWDSYYVRNWSMWLDTIILLRTIRAVLCGKGAY